MKLRGIAAVAAALGLLLAGCGSGGSGSENGDGDATTIEMQTTYPQDHLLAETTVKFAELVEEYSDGALKIKTRYGDPFGELYDISGQVARGLQPITAGIISPEIDQRYNLAIMGGVTTDWDVAERFYSPGSDWMDLMNQIGSEAGIQVLGIIPTGWGGTAFSGKAPTDPIDGSGFTIRVPPYTGMEARMKGFGYKTVVMPFGDVFSALQTGSIDGKGATPYEEVSSTFADVVDVFVDDRSYFEALLGLLVNKEWLEKQSDDVQAAIEKAGNEAVAWSWQEGKDRIAAVLDSLPGRGVEVETLTDEQYAKVVEISREAEWPVLRDIVGDEMMDQVEDLVTSNVG